MDLKDFVAASLQQIVAGVKQAQAAEDGENINADGAGLPSGKNAFSSGSYGTFTIVEFDVAVSAETSGKGGANLKVFGVGVDGGGEHKSGTANRIAFAIPVRLPDGDNKRAEEIKRRNRVHRAERSVV
ncbi:trypco2 family protein [Ensifer aridi]|uniref:trypco2 family protein n=1 Tax=Ensifer aridi TaxID=1708715 RepID=UPI0009BE1AB5|nr:trypco2 family protein [Ensifer aridi]